jgi:hypothetical protein
MPTELKQRRGPSEGRAAMVILAVAAILMLLAYSLLEREHGLDLPDAAKAQGFYALRISPWPGLQ